MSMIIDGSAGVTFPNSTVQASAGQVLQVVQGSTNTTVTGTTSTYADTGVTATITPKFATSKVLVMLTLNGLGKDTSNTSINLKLQKNSADLIVISAAQIAYTASTASLNVGDTAFNYLDSPATTSATTYKVQFASNANSANVYVCANNAYSTITLMEIAQ
jgi:hypothetical protein